MAFIGIDLGTTNSVGAYYDGREPHILPSTRADGLVPSVVVFRKPRPGSTTREEILVGQAALDYAYKDPENAIFSIKRLMGRNYDEPKVAEVRDRTNYKIVRASNSTDPGVRVLLGDKEYTPVQISAFILKEIKKKAEDSLGEPVTHAVITVPAYFEERQRAATRKAGEEAGLIVKKIIDEPSAAAIAYGLTVSQGQRRRFLVFDLGGGTFDVSIIQTVMDPEGKNHFDVLEIRGDNWLGGDDFDREIVNEIVAWVEDQYGFDPSGDKIFQLLAKQSAERAKVALSNAMETDITLPAVTAAYKTPTGQMVDLEMRITREQFEKLIQSYVDRCLKHVHEALNAQSLGPENIDNVLMVGGSTLVPLVYESVANLFGKEKIRRTNPYHSVALGAGILAATLKGIQCPNPKCKHVNDESLKNCENCGEPLAAASSVGGVPITEVTAMSFGISAVRGDQCDAFEVIIPKGTVYPLNRPMTKTFYTTAENFICIPVYEGNNPIASSNEEQGVIELSQEDFGKAGVNVSANTPVDVSMNYTRDRELYVKIRVHGINIEKEEKLRRDRPRQTTSAGTQAGTMPQDDKNWQEELEHLLNLTEEFRGKYLSFMEPRELTRLERDIEAAQNVLKGDNLVEGRRAYNTLLVALDSCGVASVLFLAERVQQRAAPERAQKIGEAIVQIKNKWYENDKQGVAFLMIPLRAAIAAELRAREAQKEVLGQEDFGGRVRVR